MKHMAEGNLKLIQDFADRIAGPSLSRGIARLYSQHTRLRAGTSGLSSWTNAELVERLAEGERLLVAGMAIADSADQRRCLRRAGEIFEWVATTSPAEMPIPVVLLAASAYQLAGFPARASGVLSEYRLPDTTSRILASLLRADFPGAQKVLLDTWRHAGRDDSADNQVSVAILNQVLRAMGVLTAWLRWGEGQRIDRALAILGKVSEALRYDSDRFSWLLAVVFAAIGEQYRDSALWTVLPPLGETMSADGRHALDRYARVAFIERKALTWPSQQAGISGILSEGSFALCTPTGSGKTRVAELVILRHLFGNAEHEADRDWPFILYLAPSRALSAEVEAGLSRSLRSIKARSVAVTSLYGGNDFGPSDLTSTGDQPTVLISTHEKADALLRFLGPSLLRQVSCVIIDEAHTVAFTGETEELIKAQNRSLRLESLVSRLKALCSPATTFVALSAVAADLSNVLSAWVTGTKDKQAIAPNYRSTRQLFGQLLCLANGATTIQYDVLDGQVLSVGDREGSPYVPNPFPPHPQVAHALRPSDSVEKRMRAHLLWAAMHFAQPSDGKRHSVLISVTEHPEWYAQTFLHLLTDDWAGIRCPQFFAPPTEGRGQDLLSLCLDSCADYFGSDSREHQLLERGIVLHHGKMPPVMSRLLVELIQLHVVNIVIATSTLSEGVNLPFETVLLPCLRRGGSPVNAKEIVNVAGRAGRPGVSTEGRTLVLLASRPTDAAQRMARHTYQGIVRSMTGETDEATDEPCSPLHALIAHIRSVWMEVAGNRDHDDFISWLETTAFSHAEGTQAELLTSLDTLDQQLLAGIEEAESLTPGIAMEDFLQSLWHNTLARHDRGVVDLPKVQQAFTRRGIALEESIYPERARRRALYHTGLPPRDGSVLIERLPQIKEILTEALDYAAWSIPERMSFFARLVAITSQIEAFGVRDLRIGRARYGWMTVLTWWMAPETAERGPTPTTVSRWYGFTSKHFIYGLNWALGAIVGSILERDGREGTLSERWQRAGLPWSVLWCKDMVSWGTLDPVASYALARKQAFTRPAAAGIAAEYWETINEITDAALEPRRVAEWMQTRATVGTARAEDYAMQPQQVNARLIEDFSGYSGPSLRVLPSADEDIIDWFDPAGYLLARSEAPPHWRQIDITKYDFILDPLSSVVTCQHYV